MEFSSLEIGPLQHRVDIPVRRTKVGPVAAVAGGIEVEVTGGGAFEGIDQAMHTTGSVRLRDVEADMVAMAAEALQPQQIGPGLEAGKCHQSPAVPPAQSARAFLGRTPGPMHRPSYSDRRARAADRPGAR